MKKRLMTFAVALLALIALTVGIGFATFSWSPGWDLSEAHTIESDWLDVNDEHIHVTLTRSALDTGTGKCDITAEVTVQEMNGIDGIWFETCTDANTNGNIEVTEWTEAAEGTVVSDAGVTTATIASFAIDADFDGYRLRTEWGDGGEGLEMLVAPGLTFDF